MTLLIDAGSLVCSGAAMDLNVTEHTMSMNGFVNAPPKPGQSGVYNSRLAQSQYMGIDNPTHQITGTFDDTGRSYTQSLTNNGYYFVTGSMLKGIMLTGSVFALIDPLVNTSTGYGNGSMCYVVPAAFNQIRTPATDKGGADTDKTKRGYIIDYSMSFREVQV